nr:hypothetical protein CFP56_03714 [Quercus suber]
MNDIFFNSDKSSEAHSFDCETTPLGHATEPRRYYGCLALPPAARSTLTPRNGCHGSRSPVVLTRLAQSLVEGSLCLRREAAMRQLRGRRGANAGLHGLALNDPRVGLHSGDVEGSSERFLGQGGWSQRWLDRRNGCPQPSYTMLVRQRALPIASSPRIPVVRLDDCTTRVHFPVYVRVSITGEHQVSDEE